MKSADLMQDEENSQSTVVDNESKESVINHEIRREEESV